MDEIAELRATADSVLRDHCSPQVVEATEGSWSPDLWTQFVDLGLTRAGVPENVAGLGGGNPVAAEVVMACARAAAPIPVAETTMLAGWLRGEIGLEHGDQPTTVITAGDDGSDLRCYSDGSAMVVSGSASAVPWAEVSEKVLVVMDEPACVLSLDRSNISVKPGRNLAGEPRGRVDIAPLRLSDAAIVDLPGNEVLLERVHLRWALARTVMMAAALEEVLKLTISYTGERVQFGRPVSRFQAVRQSLAVLAGHAAQASVAADAAVHHADDPNSVMAARVVSAKAASSGARIAHQLFGTMGFTREHRLQQLTRRLWAWRDEGGTERYWTERYGSEVSKNGAAQVWECLVETAPKVVM